MGLSCWNEGSDSDHVRGVNRDIWLVGHRKILAWQWAKLPRYGREGAVEVRPFPAKKRLLVSEAQGLSSEAMKGNPPTTVILRVDESKPSPRTTEDLAEQVLKAGKAERHRLVHHRASWVTFRIRPEEDIEAAKDLIRLAYDNANKMIAGTHIEAGPKE